jgi:TIR domain
LSSSTPTVFLSYRRKDAAVHAGWLHDEMTARFGEGQVFIDVDLEPAVNFVERISEVLGACSVMVVMIGPSWLTVAGDQGRPRLVEDRDFVRFEVETALRRGDVRVIPVLVAGAEMPEPAQLPESLRTLPDLNAIDLSDDLRRRKADVSQLLIAVEGGSTDQEETPPFWLPLLKGLLVTAAAGVAGGLLGGAIDKSGTDDVTTRILSNVTQRALTWALIGTAIAVWMTMLRGESRGLLGRGLLGLIFGALAGALGGAIFGAALNLPAESLAPETERQIQVGALAVTGGVIGALLGKLWIPARAGPGFVAGAAGGALAQIVLNAGEWSLSSPLAVACRSVTMVAFVLLTMFALDSLRTTASAQVKPAF